MNTRDGPLTDDERQRIAQNLQEIQAAENIPDVAMGRMIGCSGPLYSQLKRLKYKGDQDRWLLAARAWMRARADRAEAVAVEYVPTRIGEMILTVCRRARTQATMGRVITPSGCGKTVALIEFARRHSARCLYLAAGECFSGKAAVLYELAGKLGRKVGRHWKLHALYAEVREVLAGYYGAGKGLPFCLLVDEATTLRADALNMLRNLHDDLACRAAIVLADTWRLDAELSGRMGARGMAGGYEQLRTRFGADYLVGLDAEIALADVRAVADSILAGLGHRRKLRADAYKYLQRLAQCDGKFRNVEQRLKAAYDTAEACGAPCEYSVAQLDYVATLVGHDCQIEHAAPPFGGAQRPAARRVG